MFAAHGWDLMFILYCYCLPGASGQPSVVLRQPAADLLKAPSGKLLDA